MHVPFAITEVVTQRVGQPLFFDLPNSDLYWQALVLVSNRHKDAARQLAEQIRANRSTALLIPLWKMNPPPTLSDIFDKLLISSVWRDPQLLSSLGLFESIGLKAHNAYLNDFTIEAGLASFNEAKSNWHMLEQYSLRHPDESSVFLQVCLWKLRQDVAFEPFLLHPYPITQIFGALQDLTMLLTVFHRLDSEEDYENYLLRLQGIPEQFRQIKERMNIQAEKGILPPRFSLEKQIQSISSFIAQPENLFYQHFAQHCANHNSLNRAKAIIEQKVIPAYRSLQDSFKDLLKKAPSNHGVWALPNGDAYYDLMLRFSTTTSLTAEQIHDLGLREVERVEADLRLLMGKVGLNDPSKDIGALLRAMAADPTFYYPNTDEGKRECLAQYEMILARSQAELWPLFNLKPKSKVRMETVPKHEENGAPVAYYFEPSIDGERPGTFYVNLHDMRDHPKFRMPTLAVHEAEPGHHFQCSLQCEQENPTVCKLVKQNEFTAFIEGWALYAERLGFENGFYRTVYEQIGHLQDELFRAVRLVVDTGIHRKRWNREEAIQYMMAKCGYSEEGITTEVERYFVMPGQACSYKIGQLKILELRNRAKGKLGSAFDIRQFHDVVLQSGALPLDILDEEVDRYISKMLNNYKMMH